MTKKKRKIHDGEMMKEGYLPPPWRIDINPEISAAFCLGQLAVREWDGKLDEIDVEDSRVFREMCKEKKSD